jgi:hypothetical protein
MTRRRVRLARRKIKKNKNKKIEDWGRQRLPAKVGIPTLGNITGRCGA